VIYIQMNKRRKFSVLIENKLTEHENQSTISSPVHNVIADVFVYKRMQLSFCLFAGHFNRAVIICPTSFKRLLKYEGM
jgi:hypothetical protein